MSVNDIISQKRADAAVLAKEQQEQQAMFAELKKMQMASLMGSGKSTVILTDQTDLGDKLKAMVADFRTAVEATNPLKLNADQLTALKSLENKMDTLIKAVSEMETYDGAEDSSAVLEAIRSIDLSPVVNIPAPVVNVPAPIVNVKAKDIDMTPVSDAIRQLMVDKSEETTDKICLEDYRAQDIRDSGDTMQYIGFMNPSGDWYIIENDIKANTMRYLFGRGDYEEHFRLAGTYVYRLLNEALDATV